jgi:hypothetical protein
MHVAARYRPTSLSRHHDRRTVEDAPKHDPRAPQTLLAAETLDLGGDVGLKRASGWLMAPDELRHLASNGGIAVIAGRFVEQSAAAQGATLLQNRIGDRGDMGGDTLEVAGDVNM